MNFQQMILTRAILAEQNCIIVHRTTRKRVQVQ